MKLNDVIDKAKEVAEKADSLGVDISELQELLTLSAQATDAGGTALSPFIIGLTVFVLAVFVGYYVVWKVTPALHSPLMAITNAISSVIIVGALLACGIPEMNFAKVAGFIAIVLASINIFGGFIVTQRMLEMFMKKKKK